MSHRRFLYGKQVREKMLWTAGSAVIIWTAYEFATFLGLRQRLHSDAELGGASGLFRLLFCAIPIIRDAHFYFAHRRLCRCYGSAREHVANAKQNRGLRLVDQDHP